jgi:hypothetical protein
MLIGEIICVDEVLEEVEDGGFMLKELPDIQCPPLLFTVVVEDTDPTVEGGVIEIMLFLTK